MAKYTTKLGLEYTFDKNADISDEEAAKKAEAFGYFSVDFYKIFRKDLTLNEKAELKNVLKALSSHFVYGRLDFDLKKILSVEPGKAKIVLNQLKGLNAEINSKFYPEKLQDNARNQ